MKESRNLASTAAASQFACATKSARRRPRCCLGHATVITPWGARPISAIRRYLRSLVLAAIVGAGETADSKSSVIPEQQFNIAESTYVQTRGCGDETAPVVLQAT